MLEQTTKTLRGVERLAMRWGPDGKVYVCDLSGDCYGASIRALIWAQNNGVDPAEVEREAARILPEPRRAPATNRRRRMTGRGR